MNNAKIHSQITDQILGNFMDLLYCMFMNERENRLIIYCHQGRPSF